MILRLRSGFRQRAQTPANRLNFNVWSERKRIEKLRYIHRNPVKRGLVPEPELWEWSSYRSYAFGEGQSQDQSVAESGDEGSGRVTTPRRQQRIPTLSQKARKDGPPRQIYLLCSCLFLT